MPQVASAPGQALGPRQRLLNTLSHRCIPGTVPGTMGRAGESETVWVWVAPPHKLPLVPSQRVVCRGGRQTEPGVLAGCRAGVGTEGFVHSRI